MVDNRNISTGGGNYNENIVGDYVQGDYYNYSVIQEEFMEITLQELESQFKDSPNIKTDILNILKKERLLVLSGDLGIDKNDLALQLAFILAKGIASNKKNISVKQWKPNSNRQVVNMATELRNTKSPTIFIFTEIEPKKIVFHNLPQFHEHWVIATTERSFTSWHLEREARRFFPELTIKNIYDQNILINKLNEQLTKYSLQPQLFKCFNSSKKYQSLVQLIEDLQTIKNINRFVELFRQKLQELGEDYEESEINIEFICNLAKNDEQFISRLYYKILKPHEQLLALGISFLNGCFEDQLFAALEEIVLNAWRKRDPSLNTLDYCDLDELRDNYFDFFQNDLYETTSSNFKIIETKTYKVDIRSIKIISSENRRLLYKVAWESHRRQIINALEVLVDIVKESAKQGNHFHSGKWELYGELVRREKLYSVVSQTISDIGLVSTSALSTVQGQLLRLATDNSAKVRSVAASAIARWYISGNKQQEELFRSLQIFYDITLNKENKLVEKLEDKEWRIVEKNTERKKDINLDDKQKKEDLITDFVFSIWKKIREYFKHFSTDEDEYENDYYLDEDIVSLDYPDYIGATIAVAIGDIIYEHYGDNRLLEYFHQWLQELLESRLRLVHLYFGYYTLFWVVPLHFKEESIQKLLREIIHRHKGWLYPNSALSLVHAIAKSLAHAYDYTNNRQEVKKILDSWSSEALKNRDSEDNLSKKITQEDALLKTVILTYGLINYEQQPPIKVEEVLNFLEEVLKNEKKSYVRETVVIAICNLTYKYFELIEPKLQDFLSYFKFQEQEEIVKTLTAIYLKQRVNIPVQEGKVYQKKIKVRERRYQLWIKPEERPLTDIEKTMNCWVKLKNKNKVQQTAIQALVSFTNAVDKKLITPSIKP